MIAQAIRRGATVAFSYLPLSSLLRNASKEPRSEITILCYHDVAEKAAPGVVSRREFCRQVDVVAREKTCLQLSEAVCRIRAGDGGGRDLVALTFDDGRRGAVEIACEELNNRRLPFTLFLVVERCRKPRGSADFAGVDEVRSALGSCGSMGAHGLTHRVPLPELSDDELELDLVGCRRFLEEHRTKSDELLFCYPWASHDARVESACRGAGFTAAFAGGWRRFHRPSDLFRIGRVTVDGEDDLRTFRAKLRGGRDLQALFRSVVGKP